MTIKDFQYINSIPTGSTYLLEVSKYFGLDTNLPPDVLEEMINNLMIIKEIPLKKYIKVKGKKYTYEKDLKKVGFNQFIILESLIAEEDNVKNLNFLIALFCRPVKRKWFRLIISPFDELDYELDCNNLLEMNMEDAQALILFFYHYVEGCSQNMKIHCLNLMKEKIMKK